MTLEYKHAINWITHEKGFERLWGLDVSIIKWLKGLLSNLSEHKFNSVVANAQPDTEYYQP